MTTSRPDAAVRGAARAGFEPYVLSGYTATHGQEIRRPDHPRSTRRPARRIDRLAEKRLGRKRSTGTFLKMLALAAVEREERASELRQMLRSLPADPEAAEEIARRRRED